MGYATLLLPDEAIAHIHVSWLSPVKIRNVVFGGSRRTWCGTTPTRPSGSATYERGVDVAQIADDDEQRDLMVQYRPATCWRPALQRDRGAAGAGPATSPPASATAAPR